MLIALRVKTMMAPKWLEAEDHAWKVQDKEVALDWATWIGGSYPSEHYYGTSNLEQSRREKEAIKLHSRPKMYVCPVPDGARDRYLLF